MKLMNIIRPRKGTCSVYDICSLIKMNLLKEEHITIEGASAYELITQPSLLHHFFLQIPTLCSRLKCVVIDNY